MIRRSAASKIVERETIEEIVYVSERTIFDTLSHVPTPFKACGSFGKRPPKTATDSESCFMKADSCEEDHCQMSKPEIIETKTTKANVQISSY